MTIGRWSRWTSHRVEVLEGSMAPTLLPGDRVLVDARAYRRRPPRIGEIVLLADPEGRGTPWIKRVAEPPSGLPPGHLWLLGDAPAESRDSRQIGPVPAELLRGRVWYRYAPREREGLLE